MRVPSRTLAALLVAGSIPLFAGSVSAAPLAQSMGLKNADLSSVEQVQWRRGWRGHRGGGRWVGPAVGGFVAGAIVGGALASRPYYDDGYYAYGAAPGVVVDPGYAYAPGYHGRRVPQSTDTPAPGSSAACPRTSDASSAYPRWMCR